VEEFLRKLLSVWAWALKSFASSGLKRLKKIMKSISQGSRSPGRDLNPGPPEYEVGVLTTRPRRSVVYYYYDTI
jgi:hypothetical protein